MVKFICFLFFWILFSIISIFAPAHGQGRLVSVYVDGTASYPYWNESKKHVEDHVLDKLGPNDFICVTRLGNFIQEFDLQVAFPKVDAHIASKKWRTIFEWKKDKQRFSDAWKETENLRNATQNRLAKLEPQDQGMTEVHSMLSYAATHLQHRSEERWLLVYSDLKNETSHSDKTQYPPKMVFALTGVHVRFIYVPFSGYQDWEKLKSAWTTYFLSAGAASFAMFDVASSSMVTDVIRPSPIPQELPPFSRK